MTAPDTSKGQKRARTIVDEGDDLVVTDTPETSKTLVAHPKGNLASSQADRATSRITYAEEDTDDGEYAESVNDDEPKAKRPKRAPVAPQEKAVLRGRKTPKQQAMQRNAKGHSQ